MLKENISKITLYILSAIAVIAFIMFYAGGIVDPNAEYPEPVYTDVIMYAMYIFLGIAVVLMLGFGFWQFGTKFKENPKAALSSLTELLIIVAIFGIAWLVGSDEKIEIRAYTGDENVGFWAHMTDMLLYTIYFLVASVIAIVVGSSALSVFKKK